MNTFFTSDYHLGHDNIREYCNRPFDSLEQMNKTIIDNHNSRVKKDDLVFFLGDFCFKNSPNGKQGDIYKYNYYLDKLNGKFVFVKGNHDAKNSLKTHIEKVYIYYGGHHICLVHNPLHIDTNLEFNFVGHVHEKWKFQKRQNSYLINVGVDQWNFMPIKYDEIMKEFNRWRKENEQNIRE